MLHVLFLDVMFEWWILILRNVVKQCSIDVVWQENFAFELIYKFINIYREMQSYNKYDSVQNVKLMTRVMNYRVACINWLKLC